MTARIRAIPTLRKWLFAAAFVVFATALWATTRSEAATASVAMRDFAFQPAEVTIGVGDTVTWTNNDAEPHAVQGGNMNSPDVPPGGAFSHTFNETGDVSYVCRIHTYMTGVVHVVNDAPPPTTTTAPPASTTTAAPSTTTTAPPASTSTTAPNGSTTTQPDSTTTTTAPPSSGGPGFQDVPDDPSATYPPGTPGATTPPPATPPPSTTTTTTAPSAPPPSQEVPDDPDDSSPPGPDGAGSAGDPDSDTSSDPDSGPQPVDLGDGTVLAPYTVEGGVKVFKLDMAPTTIETAPGVTKSAYAFNGTVPGPVLRVNEGDRVRFIVDNNLPFATGVHWHGMILPNDQDGVPGITQPFIEPGDRYVYEWTAVATGTHWYHSHSSGRHIGKGLYGALEVVPRAGDFQADRDYRLLLGDTDLGFVLNGRMFPSTTRLVTRVGETVRIRVINAGDQVHAMHLHGTTFDVVAQDGNPLDAPQTMDTLTISPGQTFDLLATQSNPGQWLLHCHIFAHSHVSSDDHGPGHTGMTGMVTILDAAPAGTPLPPSPLDTLPIASTSPAPVTTADAASPTAMAGLLALLALVAVATFTVSTGRRTLVHHPLVRTTQNRKETSS